MDASIFDPVQGYAASVKSTGELQVEASIPSTVNVNVSSTSGQIETTPGAASGVNWEQKDIDTTSGGVEIFASGARKGFVIANLDATKPVYISFGGSTTLSPASGFPVGPGATFSLPPGVTTSAQIKGITATGTARIAYAEFT